MMKDLCLFFVRHGARRTNEGMRMLFDFGKGPEDLGFDLRHFREWLWTWRRVTQEVEIYDWNSNMLWQLSNIFDREGTARRIPPKVESWLTAYDAGRWQFPLPVPPFTDVDEIDVWIDRAWRVWESVVLALQFGSQRQEPEQGDPRAELLRELELPSLDEWDIQTLRILDSDRWPAVMARNLFGWIETICQQPHKDRLDRARPTLQALDDLFSKIPHRRDIKSSLKQILEELLNLPIWRRRHELYQAWVLTQIDHALEPYGPKVHHVDGTLLFSFAGTHVATAECVKGNFYVWSELRTPFESPIGRGRRRGIQPDYTITLEPITNPLSTIVVIETKQYAKASARNFAEALIDYARGRPNACVILVNYGAAPERILRRVPEELRSRTILLGHFRPGQQNELATFQELIRKALPPPPPVKTTPGRMFDLIAVDISGSMADRLKRAEALETLRWAVYSCPGARLLAVDTEVRVRLSASDEALRQLLALPRNRGTNLPQALSKEDYRRALVITDQDGWHQLERSGLKPKMALILDQEAFIRVNSETSDVDKRTDDD
jgi:hypothetical protein